jgi:hypothetical protein
MAAGAARDFGARTAFDVDTEGYGGLAARFTFDSRRRRLAARGSRS